MCFIIRLKFYLLVLLKLPINAAADPALQSQPAVPAPESVRDRSLFEVCVVAGGAYLPDYPASDQNRIKFAALPYFVYRGEIVRADREGARAKLPQNRYGTIDQSDKEDAPE